MEFCVTVCRGGRTLGTFFIDAPVDDLEFELLKQCYREDLGIGECGGLEALYLEITEKARGEAECLPDSPEEDEDAGGTVFDIEIPDEAAEAAEAEDDPAFDPEEDDEEDDDWLFLYELL